MLFRSRFLADWVYPRWRAIAGTLALTALLSAASGAYPLMIKTSFDTLLQGRAEMLPVVLAAIGISFIPRGAKPAGT